MDNELRHSISLEINAIRRSTMEDEEGADRIPPLISPILADADKWRKVKEIADGDYCSRCFNRFKCPSEDYAPCPFSDILNEVEDG